MTTTSPTADLLDLITANDLIGCTTCGTEIALIDSCCIEGHRVCRPCFGPSPIGDLEPPF